MPAQADVEALMVKYLGKETAGTMLAKMDQMVKEGKRPADIEKAVSTDLIAHIEKQVVSTVIAQIGPITPIKVKPIEVSVKPAIGPISISPKINTGVSVKVGPGIMIKGAKK